MSYGCCARPASVRRPVAARPDADAERTGEGLAAAMRKNRIPRRRAARALKQAGMGDVAVERIVGMAVGKSEGFTPEQLRTALTTTYGRLCESPSTKVLSARMVRSLSARNWRSTNGWAARSGQPITSSTVRPRCTPAATGVSV
jgi:hypothetical protein